MGSNDYQLSSHFVPCGDQEQAINALLKGLEQDVPEQILKGVTGSGKTFTMANVIAKSGLPAMILSHNKILAAQLYSEFRTFFPNNAVEYFVSYYDYYQPEAYVPGRDLFIEKDSSVNEQIEQMRLSATKSIIERRDCVIVGTVSAIYGIGDPVDYHSMVLHLREGEKCSRDTIISRLVDMQYQRNEVDFHRGVFRVRGDVIDVFPAEQYEQAVRIEIDDDRISSLTMIDGLSNRRMLQVPRFTVFPSSHFVTSKEKVINARSTIRAELGQQHQQLLADNQIARAERLLERTTFDLEMMETVGFCKGIENYSRHLSGRQPGEPPPTLLDYLPADALVFVDESHVTIPQIGAMYQGDYSRKSTLVDYGFRLPSALDNRPLKFHEFEKLARSRIYVSATPGKYEYTRQAPIIEQIIRPTGLLDPQVEVRKATTQVDDTLHLVRAQVAKSQRVLITTLTKRMAEQLTSYLQEMQIKAKYMHSDIDALERAVLIEDLRKGVFDVLVGINLLREGLDLPEVSLVCIFDADKQGFLRSRTSLIQTIGRAARHLEGKAILFADKITEAMDAAILETEKRRIIQQQYNEKHNITPQSIQRSVQSLLQTNTEAVEVNEPSNDKKKILIHNEKQLKSLLLQLQKKMQGYAAQLDFERAMCLRDCLSKLKLMRWDDLNYKCLSEIKFHFKHNQAVIDKVTPKSQTVAARKQKKDEMVPRLGSKKSQR